MMTFSVVETNEFYNFNRYIEAGLPIIPPLPLGSFPNCTNTFADETNMPPAWQEASVMTMMRW